MNALPQSGWTPFPVDWLSLPLGVAGAYFFGWIAWQVHVMGKFERLHGPAMRFAEKRPHDVFYLESMQRRRAFCEWQASRPSPFYWICNWRYDYDSPLLAEYRREVLGSGASEKA